MENSKESVLLFTEVDIGTTVESFCHFLDSQRNLFHSQVEQLGRIFVTQCQLTGVNPLSHEMAAGALSIKIGKKSKDILNPKAVKYMQSIFSVKDNINKKETHEISALCGITVTQVREFFASQRSRVRKLIRTSHEAANSLNELKPSETATSSNEPKAKAPASLNDQEAFNSTVDGQLGINQPETNGTIQPLEAAPVPSPIPISVDVGPTEPLESVPVPAPIPINVDVGSVMEDETTPGLEPAGKTFVENIFSLMRKEETFSGQVKLMDWILQIQNTSVLYWFLTRGGIPILANWLNEAAAEEQTTVLVVILKVLCHLPLHKALPVHISMILQIVNRLRFYRTSDISNRAKTLLTKWSKLLARSRAIKRHHGFTNLSAEKEKIRKQRIDELLKDESWQMEIDLPDEILALAYEESEAARKPEPLKLLTESGEESKQKPTRGTSATQTKEKRRVLPMEQQPAGRMPSGRNTQFTRVSPARPISADDIQKAKLRASYLQSKHGVEIHRKEVVMPRIKHIIPSKNNSLLKISKANAVRPVKQPTKPDIRGATSSSAQTSSMRGALASSSRTGSLREAHASSSQMGSLNEALASSSQSGSLREAHASSSQTGSLSEEKLASSSQTGCLSIGTKRKVPEPSTGNLDSSNVDAVMHERSFGESGKPTSKNSEKLIRSRVTWQTPPVLKINSQWSVGAGETSKEVEVQTQRLRREKETIYRNRQDISDNPKEPWDKEMGYDDSLTPEIPIEQSPSADDQSACPSPSHRSSGSDLTKALAESTSAAVSTTNELPPSTVGVPSSEPDLELLAVLLKNPELVFALTSAQGKNISKEDTVALLDLLKMSGASVPGLLNGNTPKPAGAIPPPAADPCLPTQSVKPPELVPQYPLPAAPTIPPPSVVAPTSAPTPLLSLSSPTLSHQQGHCFPKIVPPSISIPMHPNVVSLPSPTPPATAERPTTSAVPTSITRLPSPTPAIQSRIGITVAPQSMQQQRVTPTVNNVIPVQQPVPFHAQVAGPQIAARTLDQRSVSNGASSGSSSSVYFNQRLVPAVLPPPPPLPRSSMLIAENTHNNNNPNPFSHMTRGGLPESPQVLQRLQGGLLVAVGSSALANRVNQPTVPINGLRREAVVVGDHYFPPFHNGYHGPEIDHPHPDFDRYGRPPVDDHNIYDDEEECETWSDEERRRLNYAGGKRTPHAVGQHAGHGRGEKWNQWRRNDNWKERRRGNK